MSFTVIWIFRWCLCLISTQIFVSGEKNPKTLMDEETDNLDENKLKGGQHSRAVLLGGKNSTIGMAPSTVYLVITKTAIVEKKEVKDKYTCGGTLLTPKVILTAGHCCWEKKKYRKSPKGSSYEWKLRSGTAGAGGLNNKMLQQIKTIDAKNWKTHPKWNWKKGGVDLCIISVTKNFQIDAKQVPPLIQKAVMYGKRGIRGHVVAAGWGQCKVPEKKPQCDNLQYLETGQELRRFSQAMCKKVIKPWEDGIFCLKGRWNKAAGPGDSGGPVFLQNAPRKPELGKLYTLVGVIGGGSSRPDEKKKSLISWFTDVYTYRDWIRDECNKLDPVGCKDL